MIAGRRRLAIFGLILGVVLVMGMFLPLIPVESRFSIRGNYAENASMVCSSLVSNVTAFDECLTRNEIPPTIIHGQTSVAYSLFGIGEGPYPELVYATQGHRSALLHFVGSTIAYAEDPGFYYGDQPIFMPKDTLFVSNPVISPWTNGQLNFTAEIANIGTRDLTGLAAYFDYPGFGYNATSEGIVWHTPVHAVGCPDLAPGKTCRLSILSVPTILPQVGVEHELFWVVKGKWLVNASAVMTYTYPSGQTFVSHFPTYQSFIYGQSTHAIFPGVGLSAAWVAGFFAAVNSQRIGSPLVQDIGLDQFAQDRFIRAVANYTISDYGFDKDSAVYLAGTGRISTEEILYPSTFSPSEFATYLEQNAPGHWQALLDSSYTKYGYYLQSGPAVEFSQGCLITEIPSRNINITQYGIEHGCQTKVEEVVWLLVVLSN